MEVQENYSQDRLAFIDTQLQDIDCNLEEYFKNYNVEQLSRALEEDSRDPDNSGESLTRSTSHEGFRKTDYFQIIEICNQLWVVNGLVSELTHQTQFEDRVHSYVKLNSKTNDIRKHIDGFSDAGSIKIFNELEDKLNDIKTELLQQADKKLNDYLLFSDDLEIKYSYFKDDLEFSKFLKCCRNLSNSDTNASYFNFNKIFNDWLQAILDKFDEGFSTVFEQNNKILKLKIDQCEPNLLNFTKSIEELISFFNAFIGKYKILVEFKNVRITLGKIILKSIKTKIFSKENVYPLIIDKLNYDEQQNSKVSTIAELYKVSTELSSEGWSKDGICELEFWIDDLTSSWVDNLLDFTIDELKLFVISIDNNEKADLLKEKNLISQEISLTTKEPVTEKKDDNGWGEDWDDNDGWNDNDEEEKPRSEPKPAKTEDDDIVDDGGWGDDDLDLDDDEEEKKTEENDEDGWGAWGDEVKIDDDDIEDKSAAVDASNDKPLFPSYKYSKLVDEIMTIFDNYIKNYDDLKQLEVNQDQVNEAKDLFKHGFKKLCISYFMMLESEISETYQNDILFYNDYNKILEKCYKRYEVDLTTCFKMNSRFINSFMGNIHRNLTNVISDYDKAIWSDTHFDDEKILKQYQKEFLLRFDNEFDDITSQLNKLSSWNTQLIVNTFVTVIFQSFDTICDKILKRSDISSFESDVLSEIIDVITNHTIEKTRNMNIMLERIQSFNKLEQIKLILSTNLKGILDLFYDAKLYEMETHELISLIQSLFIDSAQRTNAITEIKTIRETQA